MFRYRVNKLGVDLEPKGSAIFINSVFNIHQESSLNLWMIIEVIKFCFSMLFCLSQLCQKVKSTIFTQ